MRTRLTMSVVAVLLLVGCGGTDAPGMRKAAGSLVPAGSSILVRKDGACVEVAAFPSCHFIYFTTRGRLPLETRVRLVNGRADSAGWRADPPLEAVGGAVLGFSRGDLRASVALWPHPQGSCRGEASECLGNVDHIQVTRGA